MHIHNSPSTLSEDDDRASSQKGANLRRFFGRAFNVLFHTLIHSANLVIKDNVLARYRNFTIFSKRSSCINACHFPLRTKWF